MIATCHWGTDRYPRVKRIVFDNTIKQKDAVEKDAVELVRKRDGRVDLVTDLSPLATLSVAQSPHAAVVKSRESMGSVFGQFNMRKPGSPWRDVRLRRAVNLAINRDDVITYAAKGNGAITPTLLPKPAVGFNPDLAPYPLDVPKARQLVREAGAAARRGSSAPSADVLLRSGRGGRLWTRRDDRGTESQPEQRGSFRGLAAGECFIWRLLHRATGVSFAAHRSCPAARIAVGLRGR